MASSDELRRRVAELEAICTQNGHDAAEAIRARNEAERECRLLRDELENTKALLARATLTRSENDPRR